MKIPKPHTVNAEAFKAAGHPAAAVAEETQTLAAVAVNRHPHLFLVISMKRLNVLLVILALVIIPSLIWISFQPTGQVTKTNSSCELQEMNYYFRKDCSHCIRVSRDGSLEKLEELGVKVNKFEVVQWGMYGIHATPTFEINGQRMSGYKTFEQLKGLLGC